MILHVRAARTYHYATRWSEMADLVAMALQKREYAAFFFADKQHTPETRDWWPDNMLLVGVNAATGYGGLVWYVSPARAELSGDAMSRHCWVSDNPHPPGFDPQVLADPGAPLHHDPRSTLPLAEIRAALEEFCRAGTGDRPGSIRWVRGEINGERLEDGQGPS